MTVIRWVEVKRWRNANDVVWFLNCLVSRSLSICFQRNRSSSMVIFELLQYDSLSLFFSLFLYVCSLFSVHSSSVYWNVCRQNSLFPLNCPLLFFFLGGNGLYQAWKGGRAKCNVNFFLLYQFVYNLLLELSKKTLPRNEWINELNAYPINGEIYTYNGQSGHLPFSAWSRCNRERKKTHK